MTELLAATSRIAWADDVTASVEIAEEASAAILALSSMSGVCEIAASTLLVVFSAPNALSHGIPYVVLMVTLLDTGAVTAVGREWG